jgi:hypothetical protein
MKTLTSYSLLLFGTLAPADRRALWRAATLTRIDAWRKAAEPLHGYGSDGEGRHKVRVIHPMDSRNNLMGGAFRTVRAVHDIDIAEASGRRAEHTGWYTDPDGITSRDGDGLCWGVVAYLGHGRYLAGYVLGGTDCGGFHLDAFYDSEREAADAADSIAENVAETERDYQQRFNEATDLAQEIDAAKVSLRKALALRNDGRECFQGLRAEARELIESIRGKQATMASDYAGVL